MVAKASLPTASRSFQVIRKLFPYLLIPLAVSLYAIFTDDRPAAIRAFHRSQHRLEEIVQEWDGENTSMQLPNIGKAIMDDGFTSVTKEGECFVFYHKGFMASIDNWHEMVYAPKGHSQLPDYRRGDYNRLYELRELKGGQWFYVSHD